MYSMRLYGKVFLSMLVLVSISFGVFGTLLIRTSFQTAWQREVEIGKNENQMVKFGKTGNAVTGYTDSISECKMQGDIFRQSEDTSQYRNKCSRFIFVSEGDIRAKRISGVQGK